MFRFVVCLAVLACVAAFMAPSTRVSNSFLNMKLIAKPRTPAPAPAAAAPAASLKKAAAPAASLKKAAAPAAASKKVAAPAASLKKAAAPAAASKKVAAPAAPREITRNSNFAYGIVGSDVETGGDWDPLGLADGKSEDTIQWYRAAELKHGRICMLAALGLLVAPVIHLPDPVFESSKGYGALAQLYAERPQALWQIITALAAIEVSALFKGGENAGRGGDFGWDPLNFKDKYSPGGDLSAMQLRELKNGRLAMLSTAGLLLQEYQTGGLGVYEQ